MNQVKSRESTDKSGQAPLWITCSKVHRAAFYRHYPGHVANLHKRVQSVDQSRQVSSSECLTHIRSLSIRDTGS